MKNNGSIAETLTVYVSYLLVLKQLDVKNKLADKICVAFSLKNGCNAALESSLIQATFYYRFYLFRALKKVGLADRYAEIEGKSPHPAGLIEVSLKKNGKGLSGHIVLPALLSGTFVWGEQQLNLVGGRNTIAHLFPLAN